MMTSPPQHKPPTQTSRQPWPYDTIWPSANSSPCKVTRASGLVSTNADVPANLLISKVRAQTYQLLARKALRDCSEAWRRWETLTGSDFVTTLVFCHGIRMQFKGSLMALQVLVEQLGVPCHWQHRGPFEMAIFDDGVSNLKPTGGWNR